MQEAALKGGIYGKASGISGGCRPGILAPGLSAILMIFIVISMFVTAKYDREDIK